MKARILRPSSRLAAAALLVSLGVGAGTYVGLTHAADAPAASAANPAGAVAPLALNKGDHIALIGGVLPDRMQHEGSLETMIVSKYPTSDLVFRNLALSGDEVADRHRPE